MGQFGSDGYLYDFAKRSARDHMGSFGSDGYLYDFAKVNILTTFSLNSNVHGVIILSFYKPEISRKVHGAIWI